MTAEQLIKARLVIFAFNEAHWTGSLQCMLAAACVLKNRVDAGWGEWMDVLDDAERVAGNLTGHPYETAKMDLGDDNLMDLMREIDDVYHGVFADELTRLENPMGAEVRCLYYCFVERPIRDWFAKHIIRSAEHPQRAQVGQMMLYE